MMKTILLLAVVASATAFDLPSDFKTCNMSDPKATECYKNVVRDTVVSLAKGSKDFKILPIEPILVNEMIIGESNSMSLKQEYRNIKVYGLTKGLEIVTFRLNLDTLVSYSETFNPRVDFVADYKAAGKLMVISIQGEGRCNISMYNLTTTNEIHYEKFEKDGEIYIRAKTYIFKLIPQHARLQFDNLFDKNNILDREMKKFVDDNSDVIFNELVQPFDHTFGMIFHQITNNIITRVPMNKIFYK